MTRRENKHFKTKTERNNLFFYKMSIYERPRMLYNKETGSAEASAGTAKKTPGPKLDKIPDIRLLT